MTIIPKFLIFLKEKGASCEDYYKLSKTKRWDRKTVTIILLYSKLRLVNFFSTVYKSCQSCKN
nr:MAG TPA: hypothetical protein [Caudoviricetes sp.]